MDAKCNFSGGSKNPRVPREYPPIAIQSIHCIKEGTPTTLIARQRLSFRIEQQGDSRTQEKHDNDRKSLVAAIVAGTLIKQELDSEYNFNG